MLAMYLKYHQAGLTPTTPVTSIAISPVKMSIGQGSGFVAHAYKMIRSVIAAIKNSYKPLCKQESDNL
jgi:hypothetical protein